MLALINLPVLCASIFLPKRSKSGKNGAEIEKWNSETNGSHVGWLLRYLLWITGYEKQISGLAIVVLLEGVQEIIREKTPSPSPRWLTTRHMG
jgi:hypothetical protein